MVHVLLQLLLVLPLLLLGYFAEPRRIRYSFAHSMLWITAVVISTALVNLGLAYLFEWMDAGPLAMAAVSNWVLSGVFGCALLAVSVVLLGLFSVKRSAR